MKYKILFIIISLLTAAASFSQGIPGSIKGVVRDSSEHEALKNATVSILHSDSSSFKESLSKEDGSFLITNIPIGNYILKVTFSSYEPRLTNFTIDSINTALNAGIIYMQPHAHELAEVVVETPPIIIKKDTFEFTANAFATKPNATAEDLLKKLPGVDVDKDGNIRAQGESVQRVLVNGKRFFGDDPRTATQNLPSDVIDKIQVFDDQNDQSQFTGFDDGNRVKTINIVTKKNSGSFGKFVAGAGDKGLYNVAANYSMFKGNQQISFIGQLNNTNKQNFTPQDIFGSSGRGGSRGGGGGFRGGGGGFRGGGGQMQQLQSLNANSNNNGLITTSAAGINYRDVWGKNTEVYGSYFYNNLLTEKEQNSQTENFVTNDSSMFNNQAQSSSRRNVNQRLNFNMETQFDSLNSMIIRPNISYQETNNNSITKTTTTQGKTGLLNNAEATSLSNNKGYNGSIDALFRHRFKAKGRTFSLGLTGSGNTNDANGNNYSLTDYYTGGIDSSYTINQHYVASTKAQGISATASYTEPIGKRSLIELNYNYNYNKNTSDKVTYNYDSATEKFTTIDSLLTNNYENTYSSNRVTLNYRFQTEKMNFSVGNGIQFGNLTSINNTKDINLTQHYTNLYPTANLTYRFNRTSNFRFNYSGRTSQPNVTQLQPVIDNSDPLNVEVGNPNLKQSFTHSFRALYNNFSFNRGNNFTSGESNFHNIFATVNASFTTNDIVESVKRNKGIDTVTYTNLSGAYNISAFFNYGFQLKKPKSNLNFTTNFTSSKDASIINDTINYTNNYTIGETVKFTTNLKKNFDMNFSATPTYNIVRYSFQADQNDNYFSQNLSVGATYYTTSGWILESDFNYTAYSGRSDGYNTAVPLWNASFAKQFLKGKAGELRFSVYDLLNQNQSITRTVAPTYIRDVQTKVLTRYFMLTFTYNLRNFSKGQQQQQQRRLPDFRRDGNMPPPPAGGAARSGPPPDGPSQ